MTVNQKLTHTIANRVVSQIHQDGKIFQMVFTDGSTLQIKLEDPASSVMLRAASGELQYVD